MSEVWVHSVWYNSWSSLETLNHPRAKARILTQVSLILYSKYCVIGIYSKCYLFNLYRPVLWSVVSCVRSSSLRILANWVPILSQYSRAANQVFWNLRTQFWITHWQITKIISNLQLPWCGCKALIYYFTTIVLFFFLVSKNIPEYSCLWPQCTHLALCWRRRRQETTNNKTH